MEKFDQDKYDRARKKIKDIKGFYIHLTIYLIVNGILILTHIGVFSGFRIDIGIPDWGFFTTPLFWGIGVVLHGLHVFQHKLRFFKDWEERKIKKFMEKEEEKTGQRWD